MKNNTGQARRRPSGCGWIKFLFLGAVISIFFQAALCEVEPTESQCRPYIEKALKEQQLEVEENTLNAAHEYLTNEENSPTDDLIHSTEGSILRDEEKVDDDEDDGKIGEDDEDGTDPNLEGPDGDIENEVSNENDDEAVDDDKNDKSDDNKEEVEFETTLKESNDDVSLEDDLDNENQEGGDTIDETDNNEKNLEKNDDEDDSNNDDDDDDDDDDLERPINIEIHEVEIDDNDEDQQDDNQKDDEKVDAEELTEKTGKDDGDDDDREENEGDDKDSEKNNDDDEKEEEGSDGETEEERGDGETEEERGDGETEEERGDGETEEEGGDDETEEKGDNDEKKTDVDDKEAGDVADKASEEVEEENQVDEKDEGDDGDKDKADEDEDIKEERKQSAAEAAQSEEADGSNEDKSQEATPEEELTKELVIPENLRPRDHINKILKLDDSETETTLHKTIDVTLKSLKALYDSAIKPLEMLYKYRDLSNRHFGDPEIFSKPLILFMGPWSGGKSSTINYLLDNEFSHTSLRTGAEPSPAYFNILMHGTEEEILDGTQLAADWTFSGLQKFGQSLLDRLRGIKLPNKLLEKVNIVEIPGILEIRKQVQRLFPFNDACQWFIDRADIIFLVYDPSKLDVGPETEAILDQLKGREYQTRIILNKADQVKPEELMRVQGTLIWNISPLMSSSEPPIMYSTSLWSMPYEAGAPTRLLLAQERAFLRDLREAIDKRVENKIASARRFAVRVRNHAKMVDCYLTTYYNHKTIFGNRKKISDDIIEYPQKYHIYEGLSTLTNISRYDLPDPDVYKDFFKINPLYDFKKLSETCTYFRGCPINQLDVAIAYDLPELVGKYKKAIEISKEQPQKENS